MIVVDASFVVMAIVDDAEPGERARERLRGQVAFAPEILDLEVVSALRSLDQRGAVPSDRLDAALGDLGDLRINRVGHQALLDRCWELRHNVTIYDAAYVVLAEALEVSLITADARLAAAPGPRCRFEVME